MSDEDGKLDPKIARTWRGGPTTDDETPHTNRRCCSRTAAARLPGTTALTSRPGPPPSPKPPGCWVIMADRSGGPTPTTSGSSVPIRDRVQPFAGGVRRDRQAVGTQFLRPGESRAPRRAGGWSRCSQSTSARVAPRAVPRSPGDTACSTDPRRLSHHRLDVQPARQVAQGHNHIPWRRPIRCEPELPTSSHVWRQDHKRVQPPGLPCFIDHVVNKRAEVVGSTYRRTPTPCYPPTTTPAVSGSTSTSLVAGKQPAQTSHHGEGHRPLEPADRDLGVGGPKERLARITDVVIAAAAKSTRRGPRAVRPDSSSPAVAERSIRQSGESEATATRIQPPHEAVRPWPRQDIQRSTSDIWPITGTRGDPPAHPTVVPGTTPAVRGYTGRGDTHHNTVRNG